MTNHTASLFFITEPAPGTYAVNIKVGNYEFLRVAISREQLANATADGASMLLRKRPLPIMGDNSYGTR